MSQINSITLENYAPEVLLSCRATLGWLESNGQGDSLAAADLRYAIDLLQEAGVDLPQILPATKDTQVVEDSSEDVENEQVYSPDLQERAELLQAIAESELEEAHGIYHTTDEVKAHLAKVREDVARKPKPRKRRTSKFNEPTTPEEIKATMEVLAKLDALAVEIGKHWTGSVSAVDAVREMRREL